MLVFLGDIEWVVMCGDATSGNMLTCNLLIITYIAACNRDIRTGNEVTTTGSGTGKAEFQLYAINISVGNPVLS